MTSRGVKVIDSDHPETFPQASSIDYTIALYSPLLDEQAFSNLVLQSAFVFTNAVDTTK